MSASFSEETFTFLRALGENNSRDWLNEHKAEYEAQVRQPALAFIRAMAPELELIAPEFTAEDRKVGGSLMRVHRDVRFSKNKLPYKTNIGIQFRHRQGKDVHAPGFYLHIEAHEVFVGAGIWHPETDTLRKIRSYIDAHPTRWQDVLEDSEFAQWFHMSGDALKRPPRGFDAGHPLIEEIKRKDFIAIAPLVPELMLEPDLPALIGGYFAVTVPLMQQLCRAIGVPY
ncbi:MAG: TIGR02453 family protein [Zetaproteobacteria bacterium CG12_big_fil_rev_8_21_14_0_65_55_1124]|nr:MAG: TIGR02453 family protein [Zetaproteobacteria bacterium CG1_02_55_237]PIS20045.1 MAG: TIGR02453 family protein [Zetaproteobacteria bacterium CG08_land_8_20_14_0_20_55_17]PIW42078.1 MAG: TIGR02453 family protein [Zetaproteobacteria bacterium CG12_big_fil_rev_8_21_14_0_65_55_1124]PIY52900.1 MAG: TIGR02453 family protein [Zetaproteobacteria bacterium CG_4_10_14_0_8_um_filter_55_43]PIZ39557.1 MAG: TIGR02453 family protein [Zetaproteobacteria bacterium CG_4_10_14_0_2_um_filter_55_20]PJB79897